MGDHPGGPPGRRGRASRTRKRTPAERRNGEGNDGRKAPFHDTDSAIQGKLQTHQNPTVTAPSHLHPDACRWIRGSDCLILRTVSLPSALAPVGWRRRFLIPIVVLFAGIGMSAVAVGSGAVPAAPPTSLLTSADSPSREVVDLPTFTVEERPVLPEPEAWRHASIPGFEVLSNASENATRRIVRDFQRFHQALVTVWPPAEVRSGLPTLLILCGRDRAFAAFAPEAATPGTTGFISVSGSDGEVSAIILDMETSSLGMLSADALAAPEPPAPEGDEAEVGVLGGLPDFAVSPYEQLYREYLRLVLSRAQPRAPAWFEEGLAQLFMRMEFSPTHIIVGRVEDPNTRSLRPGMVEDRDFNAALQRRALLPMEELFTVAHDSPTARRPLGGVWSKQAYAFVHLCLYSGDPALQKGLLTFVRRLAGEPPSEALFRSCFGRSYADAQQAIRAHVDFTRVKAVEFRLKKGERREDPPDPVFRDATQGEIGRIKGDALRLCGRPETARTELLAAYLRGERDPALLAALGLEELAAGKRERGRRFLEAAARGNVVRPRVYIQLARWRLESALAARPDPAGKLDEAELAPVLQPLGIARRQPPPQFAWYQTLTEAWWHAAVTPPAAQLAVLDEGVRLFPRQSAWLLDVARLKQRAGLTADAAAIAEYGAKTATEPALREAFELFRRSLPPSVKEDHPTAPAVSTAPRS